MTAETAAQPRWRALLPWAVLALAAAVMVAGLVAWWRADRDDALALADTRDDVLIAATHHIEVMNSLDYREVDQGLDQWLDVTTGTLRDSLTEVADEERQLLADQKKVSAGRVVDAAVLDIDGGTATVLASVEVTVQDGLDPEAEPSVKRNRYSADLVEVRGTWLLESLEQVAVEVS